jgi:hypothetical protein
VIVRALHRCHPDCRYCSAEWLLYLKGLMSRRTGGQDFYAAAATSIKVAPAAQEG